MRSRSSGGPRAEPHLPVAQAVALGALHGPAELLPVSSSAHLAVVPWLLGWNYEQLDAQLRKSFEVALHAGTAAALMMSFREEVGAVLRSLDTQRLALMGLSFAPPAVLGYSLERPIERHLGKPPTIAGALLAGAVAMTVSDHSPCTRGHHQAGPCDALWLGIAQACALVPGVSRNGATLSAARLRGFTRADANRLSRHVGLPVIAGATILKAVRLHRLGLTPGTGLALAAGAAAAFASTLGSTRVVHHLESGRSLAPYAAYRAALGLLVVARVAEVRRRRST